MTRWKMGGIIVVFYPNDHRPRHVHVVEDGKRDIKFDLEHWKAMDGVLSPKAGKVLEELKSMGVFDVKKS